MENSIYRQFAQGERQCTRLLSLLPSSDPTSIIKCRLFEVELTSAGAIRLGNVQPYSALSYAWQEDGQETHKTGTVLIIIIDGPKGGAEEIWLRHEIPRNLFHALLRLRKPQEDRLLWVDSICINQKDNSERTHQVAMMHSIYRMANDVVIWLGERTTDDELGEWLQSSDRPTATYIDWADEHCEDLVKRYLDEFGKIKAAQRVPSFISSSSFEPIELPVNPLKGKRDVFGAFCLLWLLAQGHRPDEIDFYHSFLSRPRASYLLDVQRFNYA